MKNLITKMNNSPMYFDFSASTERRGTNSYKWDSRSDVPADTIPLWVADMDFRVAPAITQALSRIVDRGIFGYTFVPSGYYDAVCSWFKRRHEWEINREMIIYTSGVVPAISAIIKGLTRPGEKVLIQTPVYNCFFSSIRNNGCTALSSPLKRTGNSFEMDFTDLEAKAADPDCRLMLLCNPHNPAGRVWTHAELKKVAEICARNGVTVVSDEIHCELVFPPLHYTPFAPVAKEVGCRWLVCMSPSKAFNIAGLQIANIVAGDEELRRLTDRAINDNEVCDVNPFGVAALQAAYNESEEWLEQLLPYLQGNYRLLRDTFTENLPQLPVMELEGTYLAWIDCRVLGIGSEELEEILIKEAHVWLNAGAMYGTEGEGYMRVNLACQRQRLETALERLVPVLKRMLESLD